MHQSHGKGVPKSRYGCTKVTVRVYQSLNFSRRFDAMMVLAEVEGCTKVEVRVCESRGQGGTHEYGGDRKLGFSLKKNRPKADFF